MVSKIIHFITEVYDAVYPKVKNAIIGALVFGLLGLVINFAWWRYAPYEVATVEQPITVLNDYRAVSPNDILRLGIIVEKSGNYTASNISTNVICSDGGLYGVERVDVGGENVPQGSFVRERQFRISANIPKGTTCYFQFDLDYEVNPVRTIRETWKTEVFEVV